MFAEWKLPKSVFSETIVAFAFVVKKAQTAAAKRELSDFLLTARNAKTVQTHSESEMAILVDGDLGECRARLQNAEIEFEICEKNVEKTRNFGETLSRFLPSNIRFPSAFEIIGKRALIALKSECLPYKFEIGEALLRTQTALRSVYNKIGKLENEFRTPSLELIAGEASTRAQVVEGKVTLQLDIETVYFCSKLEHERSRVLSELCDGDLVFDAFCGVGPFALRAARERRCVVYANDLNPNCHAFLLENVRRNRLSDRVHCSNADARAFLAERIAAWRRGETAAPNAVFMNLPALAVEFLDAFDALPTDFAPFRVYVYCFESETATRDEIESRVRSRLGALSQFDAVHRVKHVSNAKIMYCVSLTIFSSAEVALAKRAE